MSDELDELDLEDLKVESGLAATDDFFEEVGGIFGDNRIDDMLADRFSTDEQSSSVLAFALGEEEKPQDPTWGAGTRVAFSYTLRSILTYNDLPAEGVKGTVVKVRCGSGDVTHENGYVHTHWDDGKFRPILAEHLEVIGDANSEDVRMVVADLGDLAGFFAPTTGMGMTSGDELVHKATKDLWSLKKDGGNFVLERLFQDDGSPLKE